MMNMIKEEEEKKRKRKKKNSPCCERKEKKIGSSIAGLHLIHHVHLDPQNG